MYSVFNVTGPSVSPSLLPQSGAFPLPLTPPPLRPPSTSAAQQRIDQWLQESGAGVMAAPSPAAQAPAARAAPVAVPEVAAPPAEEAPATGSGYKVMLNLSILSMEDRSQNFRRGSCSSVPCFLTACCGTGSATTTREAFRYGNHLRRANNQATLPLSFGSTVPGAAKDTPPRPHRWGRVPRVASTCRHCFCPRGKRKRRRCCQSVKRKIDKC